MKKSLTFSIIFLILILSACATQQVTVTPAERVTVTSPPPTATIIPTPTLHPQFIAVQDTVAASEGFTLNSATGLLELQTENGVVLVDGITIDPDGSATFTNADEEISFDPNTITFGADSFTVDINGQTWKWDAEGGLVPAAPDISSTEAGQATMALFAETGIDPALVELKYAEDGVTVICVDKVTGDEVCRDGAFDLHWLVSNLPSENLDMVDIKPKNIPSRVGPADFPSDYYVQIAKNEEVLAIFPDEQYSLAGLALHADVGGRYAWGMVLIDKLGRVKSQLTYYDASKKLNVVPLIEATADMLEKNFYSNPDYLKESE